MFNTNTRTLEHLNTMKMDSFEEYLVKKKIDSTAFKSGEESLWQEWKILFEQVHPDSFTAQKLFLINKIRRSYSLDRSEGTPSNQSAIKKN